MSEKQSLADRLEAFLTQHPGIWHDGHVIADKAGFAGWRGRISDLRKRGLRIENRMRRVKTAAGSYTVTEYRFTPVEPVRIAVQEQATSTGDLFGPRGWLGPC